MSQQLQLDDLTALLRECAGEEEPVDLAASVLDTPFADLGYDSLAMLEATTRIEREYQIVIDEDAMSQAGTPREYLALVNEALAAGKQTA
jgi:minimal PKS acyl carrier protein